MKPLALIIVVGILFGIATLILSSSGESILGSFPPLKALVNKNKNANKKIETSNIFRTIDEGEVWFPQSNTISADTKIGNIGVLDIALDVVDSNIGYVGTASNGLYKTINNGQNWEKLFDRNQVLLPNAGVLRVVQDTRKPDNIYLAAYQNERGVFLKSTDKGLSFIQTYIAEYDKYAVSAITVDPKNSNVIYIGTTQGGFFKSSDYGSSWEVIEWITGSISEIVINNRNTNEIYVATSDRGLFRTEDGGKKWKNFAKEISKAAASNQVKSIQIDPTNANILYLGVTNGLLKSLDRGESWKFLEMLIPPTNLPIDSVKVDPTDRNNVYVGVKDLIYKSEDGGTNWSVKRIILPTKEKRISVITIDTKEPQSVYLGIR
ncbi:MAG: YCF48-related protein [Patescibacteria group bacterium]